MNPFGVFLILATAYPQNYDDHTFALESNNSAFVLINDSGFFPSVQDNYVVQNIGRSTIKTELWYGDEVQWFGVVIGAIIKPGETKVLDNGGKIYYYTGLKVMNNDRERAIFHGRGGYLQTPYTPGPYFEMFKGLRKTFDFAVKYVHWKTDAIFEELVSKYWPDKRLSVWNEILNQITPLLDRNITEKIQETIQNELDIYRYKLLNLNLNDGANYMSIASDLVNLEDKFIFLNSEMSDFNYTNAYVLPLFSNVVSLKMHFYTLGIQHNASLKLSQNDADQIRLYSKKMVDNAHQHITDMSKKVIDYAYNYSEAPTIFNNLMTIRSHLAIHGYEYLPIWSYMVMNPFNNSEITNPVVSYSTFFGRATPNLYAQSTGVVVPPPLNLTLENSRIIFIDIYYWSENPQILKIGGAKIWLENGAQYVMGTTSGIVGSVNLKNTQILKITAYGEGKIDGLKFHLSSGDIESFGQVNTSTYEDFMLPDHYISSFYLSSDTTDLKGQAANIAVTYQWYVQ